MGHVIAICNEWLAAERGQQSGGYPAPSLLPFVIGTHNSGEPTVFVVQYRIAIMTSGQMPGKIPLPQATTGEPYVYIKGFGNEWKFVTTLEEASVYNQEQTLEVVKSLTYNVESDWDGWSAIMLLPFST